MHAHTNSTYTCYTYFKLSRYGSVTGDDKIMAEIFARGPVSCTIDASVLGWVLATGNTGYTSGIANYTTTPRLDHAIQIAVRPTGTCSLASHFFIQI